MSLAVHMHDKENEQCLSTAIGWVFVASEGNVGGERPMSHVVSHVVSDRQKVDTQTGVVDEGSFLHLPTYHVDKVGIENWQNWELTKLEAETFTRLCHSSLLDVTSELKDVRYRHPSLASFLSPHVSTFCYLISLCHKISQPFSVLAYWEHSNTGSGKHHETKPVPSFSPSTQKWALHTSTASSSLLPSWSTLQFWQEGQRDGGRWGMENGKKKMEWRGSGEASFWWWTASKLRYVHICCLALTKKTLCPH